LRICPTSWLSPRLMMTNHHVLGDAAVASRSLAEFGYELTYDGQPSPTTQFRFEPDTFFVANKELDYAVVAVNPAGANGKALGEFGYNLLSEATQDVR
jgi:endonuclease G, mitochondrial